MSHETPTDREPTSRAHLAVVLLVAFVAFPGTLSGLATALAVVLVPAPLLARATNAASAAAADPTTVLPEITAALAVATLVAFVAFLRLRS